MHLANLISIDLFPCSEHSNAEIFQSFKAHFLHLIQFTAVILDIVS